MLDCEGNLLNPNFLAAKLYTLYILVPVWIRKKLWQGGKSKGTFIRWEVLKHGVSKTKSSDAVSGRQEGSICVSHNSSCNTVTPLKLGWANTGRIKWEVSSLERAWGRRGSHCDHVPTPALQDPGPQEVIHFPREAKAAWLVVSDFIPLIFSYQKIISHRNYISSNFTVVSGKWTYLLLAALNRLQMYF